MMTIEECQALSKGELIEVVQEAYAEIDRVHEELVLFQEEYRASLESEKLVQADLQHALDRQTERANAAWNEALKAAVKMLQLMHAPVAATHNERIDSAILDLP